MRSLSVAFTIVLLSSGAYACGGAGRGQPGGASAAASSSAVPAGSPSERSTRSYLNDNDGDLGGARENSGYRDSDDGHISYGHTAGAADRRTVTAVVGHYYGAAAAGDGRTACAMLLTGLANAVPVNYGRGAGPSYLRGGRTCQAVMTRLFKHSHGELSAPVGVTGVFVNRDHAYALLGSTKMPASYITLQRERGTWKIDELLGSGII